MFTTTRKQAEQNKQKISVQDAYNIWFMSYRHFFMIDQLMLLNNFTHDKDLKYIINQYISKYKGESKKFETLMDKYVIKGPEPNVRGINVIGNSEVSRDEVTARLMLDFLKNSIFNLVNTLRDSAINDQTRSNYIQMLKDNLSDYNKYVKFLKAKGWLETPPLYPYVPQNMKEKISTNEVFNLWDHLVFRYNNIHLTKIYASYAYDGDFRALLNMGTEILERQASHIENTLLQFGVTLPAPYSDTVPTPESTEIFEDKFLFNNILYGLKNATALHGYALSESVVNDRIRGIFSKLLFEEIDLIDKMIKYGKLKGWLPIPPAYRMG